MGTGLEEQKKFEDIALNLNNAQIFWIALCLFDGKKCIHCSKKFPERIIRKHPEKFIPYNSYYWFTPEYLVHVKTTHGLEPEYLTSILEKFKLKIIGR